MCIQKGGEKIGQFSGSQPEKQNTPAAKYDYMTYHF